MDALDERLTFEQGPHLLVQLAEAADAGEVGLEQKRRRLLLVDGDPARPAVAATLEIGQQRRDAALDGLERGGSLRLLEGDEEVGLVAGACEVDVGPFRLGPGRERYGVDERQDEVEYARGLGDGAVGLLCRRHGGGGHAVLGPCRVVRASSHLHGE